MAESGKAGSLVIMNKSLAESEVHRLLTAQEHKIKVSTGTLPHTCIFPLSSAAFMILPVTESLNKWPPQQHTSVDPALAKKLVKFSKLHHKCYVILTTPIFGDNEQKAVSILQQKHISTSLGFLLAHNSSECVDCMCSIVKVTSKATTTVIRERMDKVQRQLLSEEAVISILKLCGVNRHTCTVLLDGCGSLAGLARASSNTEKLTECSIDSDTAQHVKQYVS